VAANFLQTSGVKFDNGEATLLLQAADIADQAKLMSVSNVVDQGLFARSEVENGVARCEMPSSASPPASPKANARQYPLSRMRKRLI
jgi:hypothetical protein